MSGITHAGKRSMQCARSALTLTLAICCVFAQRLVFSEFEVASIKTTPSDWRGGRWIRMQSVHQFAARNHTLKTLLAAAFNVSPQAISGGPSWVDSDRYDILAKTPGEALPNLNEQMAMLRKLLTDRFTLTFHRESRELPIFALTVARGGSKLKESTASPDAPPEGPPPLIFMVAPDLIRLPGRSATIAELASVMQRVALDKPVVDRTGLPAKYDFDLEWTPDETQFGGAFPGSSDASAKPGLFAAIQQQLGLRLEATKGPVDVLVIDHVEHPSAN
jgi:uncharacterized protein (TIGR03435 family)